MTDTLPGYGLSTNFNQTKRGIMKNQAVRVLMSAAVVAACVGCASVAVTNDALERNTAAALNVAPGSFKIANRADEGIKTTYDVTTADGKQYGCYVTGSVSVTGRAVSDAMCHPTNKTAEATPAQPSCNALLHAAGKC
jgi:hypothetical protein